MENKSKFGLLGLVLASVLLVGCGTTDVNEENTGAAAAGVEDQQGAEVSALDSESAIQETSLVEEQATAAVEMLTVYYFDFDKAELSADTREALDVVASVLKNTNTRIRLEGHADERGTREYNLALGERRAKAVASYLSVQGVAASRIEVISYGEEKPAVADSNEAAWAKNRRVELKK